MMTFRRLKVYETYRSSDKKPVPELRLIGQWLKKSGFGIGDDVQLIIKEHEILIRLLKRNAESDGDN